NVMRSLALSSGVAPNFATRSRSSPATLLSPSQYKACSRAVSRSSDQSVEVKSLDSGESAHICHHSLVTSGQSTTRNSPSSRTVKVVSSVGETGEGGITRSGLGSLFYRARRSGFLGAGPRPAIDNLPCGNQAPCRGGNGKITKSPRPVAEASRKIGRASCRERV